MQPQMTAGTGAALLALALAGPAHAALGEAADSVARDQTVLKASKATVTRGSSYTAHELSLEGTGHAREFVNGDGKVFAVAWNSTTPPDLKTLLGSHYATYVTTARASLGSHHTVALTTDTLVLRVMRLPRGWVGGAHLPALVPAGTDVATLR